MNYFIDKFQRSIKAKKHTEEMELKYPTSKGIVYGSYGTDLVKQVINIDNVPMRYTTTEILKTTVDQAIGYAIKDLPTNIYGVPENRNIWILNFASYKNPGGMFIKGSSAQEESICHVSNLYNHLIKEPNYYAINKIDLNRGLYQNRAIIHRNVTFEIMYNNEFIVRPCNVITCAAPNVLTAKKYQAVRNEECEAVMRDRVEFLYHVISKQTDVDILILGAWGCGVFGNDASLVAKYFKDIFTLVPNHRGVPFNMLIIHPIPDDNNYNKFKSVYNI